MKWFMAEVKGKVVYFQAHTHQEANNYCLKAFATYAKKMDHRELAVLMYDVVKANR